MKSQRHSPKQGIGDEGIASSSSSFLGPSKRWPRWGVSRGYSRSGRVERSTTEPKGPSISTPWDCTANSYLVNGFSPPMRMSSPELRGERIGLVPSDRPQARHKPLPPASLPPTPRSSAPASSQPRPSPRAAPRATNIPSHTQPGKPQRDRIYAIPCLISKTDPSLLWDTFLN